MVYRAVDILYLMHCSRETPFEYLVKAVNYEGLLRTKYRFCVYPCYVAYMNAMLNKSVSKHVRYKLKVFDKTNRCPTQLKDVW